MGGLNWIILVASFVTATLFVYGILHYVSSRRFIRARFRKTSNVGLPLYRQSDTSLKKRFLDWVSSFGKFAMTDSENTAKLRADLIQGGFRHPKGTAIFFGIQALGAVLLPLPVLLATAMHGAISFGKMMLCLILAGAGFYLPKIFLKFTIRGRHGRLDRALPDVLDLLIVCVEAGLSLQATLNRVADEVRNISLDMYQELHLTNAELRTGITREAALKNMGERTGVQSIKALVGMIVQSEKMGTSISQALRVHSNFLRVQRIQKAEEKAAKLAVKLLFPMFVFTFPAVFAVTVSPAIINLFHNQIFRSLSSGAGP